MSGTLCLLGMIHGSKYFCIILNLQLTDYYSPRKRHNLHVFISKSGSSVQWFGRFISTPEMRFRKWGQVHWIKVLLRKKLEVSCIIQLRCLISCRFDFYSFRWLCWWPSNCLRAFLCFHSVTSGLDKNSCLDDELQLVSRLVIPIKYISIYNLIRKFRSGIVGDCHKAIPIGK